MISVGRTLEHVRINGNQPGERCYGAGDEGDVSVRDGGFLQQTENIVDDALADGF
jgi:hypothetical protein